MHEIRFPDFLPGRFTLGRGCARDYRELAMFHYVAKRPATWAGIWTIRFLQRDRPESDARIAGVGVLSYPVPSCGPRERFLGFSGSRSENLHSANALVRTISRVIIHPQFRSLGLSTILVRCLCDNCDTRYVEAIAMMGRVHPLFERAGMTRIQPAHPHEPLYYILDRAMFSGATTRLSSSKSGGPRVLENHGKPAVLRTRR